MDHNIGLDFNEVIHAKQRKTIFLLPVLSLVDAKSQIKNKEVGHEETQMQSDQHWPQTSFSQYLDKEFQCFQELFNSSCCNFILKSQCSIYSSLIQQEYLFIKKKRKKLMAIMEKNFFFGNCTHQSSNRGMKIQDTQTK